MKQFNNTGVSFVRAFLPVILSTLLGTLVLPFLLPGAAVMGTMMAAVVLLCLTAAGQPETQESAAFLSTGV